MWALGWPNARGGRIRRVQIVVPDWIQTKIAIIHGAALAASCVISYWLITHILGHSTAVSRDDDFLGGMWATIATLFVYRFSYEQSIGAALSRMTSTAVSFGLCLVYLMMFPFHCGA